MAVHEDTCSPVELPERFAHFKVLRSLGKGGMGTVYLALDQHLNRRVALKVCHLTNHADAQERFKREAQAAASLRHANLCPVHEFDVCDGVPYFTMSFIEGPTLDKWVDQRGGLSQRDVALLVGKLALALQYAHERGVIHRDLKPTNIAMEGREPIVLDFGLARVQEQSDRKLTKAGAILGTPSYMSPEQVEGDPEAIGPAADIYSLGVILYELLTGRVPFEGPITAVVAHILVNVPPPPRSFRPNVDPALEAICLKALRKRPGQRWPNMEDFATALVHWVKDSPAAATLGPLPGSAAGKGKAETLGPNLELPATLPTRSGSVPSVRTTVGAHSGPLAKTVVGQRPSEPDTPVPAQPASRGKVAILALCISSLLFGTLAVSIAVYRAARPKGAHTADAGVFHSNLNDAKKLIGDGDKKENGLPGNSQVPSKDVPDTVRPDGVDLRRIEIEELKPGPVTNPGSPNNPDEKVRKKARVTAEGTLYKVVSVNPEAKTIRVESDGKTSTVTVTSRTQILGTGKKNGGLRDDRLVPGSTILVVMDGREVTEIYLPRRASATRTKKKTPAAEEKVEVKPKTKNSKKKPADTEEKPKPKEKE